MTQAFVAKAPPLVADEDGVIRVAGTRVQLETLVVAFDAGATAEEIAQQYTSLDLADVYAVISYFLGDEAAIRDYVAKRTEAARALRTEVERSMPAERDPPAIARKAPAGQRKVIRLLADENFNGDILRGLRRRVPTIDAPRIQDVGMRGADDAAVLEWAAGEGRLVLTHDVSTLLGFAWNVADLALLVECSLDEEWMDRTVFIPF